MDEDEMEIQQKIQIKFLQKQRQQQSVQLYEEMMNSSNQFSTIFSKQYLYTELQYKPAFHTLSLPVIDNLLLKIQNTQLVVNFESPFQNIFQIQALKNAQFYYNNAKKQFLKGISRVLIVWILINFCLIVVSDCLEGSTQNQKTQENIKIDSIMENSIKSNDFCHPPSWIQLFKFKKALSNSQNPLNESLSNHLFNFVDSLNTFYTDKVISNFWYFMISFLIIIINLIQVYSVFVIWVYFRYWQWERLNLAKRTYENETGDQAGNVQELKRDKLWVISGEVIKRLIIDKYQNIFLTSKKSI